MLLAYGSASGARGVYLAQHPQTMHRLCTKIRNSIGRVLDTCLSVSEKPDAWRQLVLKLSYTMTVALDMDPTKGGSQRIFTSRPIYFPAIIYVLKNKINGFQLLFTFRLLFTLQKRKYSLDTPFTRFKKKRKNG